MRKACRDLSIDRVAVYADLKVDGEFANQYARACDTRADDIFDEMLEIADDGSNDWMMDNGKDSAGWRANGEHIQRSKLRIDARKWALARMNPRKYGEKVQIAGAEDLPPVKIDATKLSAAAMRELLEAMDDEAAEPDEG